MTGAAVAVYLVAGVVAALRWGGFDVRQHYAIAGPTVAGRWLGVLVVAGLIVLLWPLYWRARRYGAGTGQHDSAGAGALDGLDAKRLAEVVAELDRRGEQ